MDARYNIDGCLSLVEFAMETYISDYQQGLIELVYFDSYVLDIYPKLKYQDETEWEFYARKKEQARYKVLSDEKWFRGPDFAFWSLGAADPEAVIKQYRGTYQKDLLDMAYLTQKKVLLTFF